MILGLMLTCVLITIIAMHENFKHTYEYPPSRMRLGLRISPLILIGNIQVCILRYVLVLQLCPRPSALVSSMHMYILATF